MINEIAEKIFATKKEFEVQNFFSLEQRESKEIAIKNIIDDVQLIYLILTSSVKDNIVF